MSSRSAETRFAKDRHAYKTQGQIKLSQQGLANEDESGIRSAAVVPGDETDDVPRSSLKAPKHWRNVGHQRRHVARVANLTLATVNSPEANMMQLYQTFVDLYLPKIYSHGALRSIWAAAPSSPALYSAIKSVSLMLVHRDSNDERLFHAANPEYSKALRDTRRELRCKDRDKYAIVGMSHMLSLCELFNDLSINASMTNIHHVHWMIAFIESYRRDPPDADVRQLLASGIRWFATWGVLLSRRAIRGFQLRSQVDDELNMDSIIIELGDLTLATAGVIEDCDALCTRNRPELYEILAVLDKVTWLEGELHRWISRYYAAAPCDQSLYWFASSKKLHLDANESKPVRLFVHIYDFPDLPTASAHISFWMCQLMLVESRITIAKTFHSELDDSVLNGLNDLSHLEKTSNGYADSVRMSMPLMGKPENGWSGRIVAIRPLALLFAHYENRCDWQKLSWCVQCAKHLGICNLKVSAAPKIEPP